MGVAISLNFDLGNCNCISVIKIIFCTKKLVDIYVHFRLVTFTTCPICQSATPPPAPGSNLLYTSSSEELGLTGCAIKEEKPSKGRGRKGGGGGSGEGSGGGGKREPRLMTDVRGLLNNAIQDASVVALNNVSQ